MYYLNDCDCGGLCCGHLSDNKLTWEYLQGVIKGTEDPIHLPIAYPAISFDKDTQKLFYQVAGIIAGGIVVGFIISNAIHEKKTNKR